MNLKSKIATFALSGALVIGGTSAAFAAGNGDGTGTGTGSKADRIAMICAHKDEVVSKLTERQTNLTARLAKLQDAEAKATAAGHTKVAERIAHRITVVQDRLDKVTDRIAKAPQWIADHCTTPTSSTAS